MEQSKKMHPNTEHRRIRGSIPSLQPISGQQIRHPPMSRFIPDRQRAVPDRTYTRLYRWLHDPMGCNLGTRLEFLENTRGPIKNRTLADMASRYILPRGAPLRSVIQHQILA